MNCPNCGRKCDFCPVGHYICFECGWNDKDEDCRSRLIHRIRYLFERRR